MIGSSTMAIALWLVLFGLAGATTQTYDFNVTWVTANPDGLYERPVIGINGQWPIPIINTTVGDRVIIHLHNQLGNETTSLHFHGFFQNGTTEMDGPTAVTQCAVAPGSSITYNFTVGPPEERGKTIRARRLTPEARPISQGRTGTIPTTRGSIPMGCGVHSSSRTRILPTRGNTAGNSSSPCPSGIINRSPPC
jgi:hypothetical protein